MLLFSLRDDGVALMNRLFQFCAAIIAIALLFQAIPLSAHMIRDIWIPKEFAKHGFVIPMSSDPFVFESTDSENRWTRLNANLGGVMFLGFVGTNLDTEVAQLNSLRDELSGFPEMSWEVIADEKDKSGWKWYRTFRTSMYGDSFIGGYGAGKTGSYIFLLKTGDGDFETHNYSTWFESIKFVE